MSMLISFLLLMTVAGADASEFLIREQVRFAGGNDKVRTNRKLDPSSLYRITITSRHSLTEILTTHQLCAQSQKIVQGFWGKYIEEGVDCRSGLMFNHMTLPHRKEHDETIRGYLLGSYSNAFFQPKLTYYFHGDGRPLFISSALRLPEKAPPFIATIESLAAIKLAKEKREQQQADAAQLAYKQRKEKEDRDNAILAEQEARNKAIWAESEAKRLREEHAFASAQAEEKRRQDKAEEARLRIEQATKEAQLRADNHRHQMRMAQAARQDELAREADIRETIVQIILAVSTACVLGAAIFTHRSRPVIKVEPARTEPPPPKKKAIKLVSAPQGPASKKPPEPPPQPSDDRTAKSAEFNTGTPVDTESNGLMATQPPPAETLAKLEQPIPPDGIMGKFDFAYKAERDLYREQIAADAQAKKDIVQARAKQTVAFDDIKRTAETTHFKNEANLWVDVKTASSAAQSELVRHRQWMEFKAVVEAMNLPPEEAELLLGKGYHRLFSEEKTNEST